MALVPGARPQPPEHGAAVDWAAALSRDLDTLDRTALKARWDGEEGKKHREQLKKTGAELLAQLVTYVKARVSQLEPAAA